MATKHPLLDISKASHRCPKPHYLVLSLLVILSTATLISIHFSTKVISLRASNSSELQNICDRATDPASCLAMVTQLVTPTTTTKLSPSTNIIINDLLQRFLQNSTSHIANTIKNANFIIRKINDPRKQAALADCVQLMEVSIDRIGDSIAALASAATTVDSHADAHAWLSSVLTNHDTCLDGLKLNGPAASRSTTIEPELKELVLRAKASLAILVAATVSVQQVPYQQNINSMEILTLIRDFPTWVTNRDRKLLQGLPKDVKADVIVAKDGSGKYKTVKEAVASVPDNSKTRFVIYVKKGIYKENVEVGKKKKNVMIFGDGMDSTIITGSLNVIDGSTTFNSATVAAVGDGFIAQDMWFQNTAGPQKHQAVALRVGADQSVINRCRIDAYQDTLYTHTNRQFYRDSYITGTVDFIFGNAAVVFQNCKLVARKPMNGQKNMVTAQGRTDPNQNTGTSIQRCKVIPSSDLEPVRGSVRSYLGRPWKEYSRTVVMQSYIADHIDPVGWSVWEGDFALKTLYYGEYMNNGAGAGTSNRVKWAGYHVITTAAEAQKFTVADLIQGGTWLKSTGVAYTEGL